MSNKLKALKLRPKLSSINVSNLKADSLEYFCKTQVLDKIIIEARGDTFDQELADTMETRVCFYFVVLKSLEYDVVSSVIFEPWLESNAVEAREQTNKSDAAMNHYIKSLE